MNDSVYVSTLVASHPSLFQFGDDCDFLMARGGFATTLLNRTGARSLDKLTDGDWPIEPMRIEVLVRPARSATIKLRADLPRTA